MNDGERVSNEVELGSMGRVTTYRSDAIVQQLVVQPDGALGGGTDAMTSGGVNANDVDLPSLQVAPRRKARTLSRTRVSSESVNGNQTLMPTTDNGRLHRTATQVGEIARDQRSVYVDDGTLYGRGEVATMASTRLGHTGSESATNHNMPRVQRVVEVQLPLTNRNRRGKVNELGTSGEPINYPHRNLPRYVQYGPLVYQEGRGEGETEHHSVDCG